MDARKCHGISSVMQAFDNEDEDKKEDVTMKTLKSNFVLSVAGMGMLIGGVAPKLGFSTILLAIGLGVCIGGIFGAIRILNEKITVATSVSWEEG